MFDGSPDVGVITVQSSEPLPLIGPGQMRCGLLGNREEVLAVGSCYCGCFVLVELDEPLDSELTDGLEQAVAEGSVPRFGYHETLVHEGSEEVGHIEDLDVTEGTHRAGGGEVEAIGEHRQASEDGLLRSGEQRVGPVDRGPEGLLAL